MDLNKVEVVRKCAEEPRLFSQGRRTLGASCREAIVNNVLHCVMYKMVRLECLAFFNANTQAFLQIQPRMIALCWP